MSEQSANSQQGDDDSPSIGETKRRGEEAMSEFREGVVDRLTRAKHVSEELGGLLGRLKELGDEFVDVTAGIERRSKELLACTFAASLKSGLVGDTLGNLFNQSNDPRLNTAADRLNSIGGDLGDEAMTLYDEERRDVIAGALAKIVTTVADIQGDQARNNQELDVFAQAAEVHAGDIEQAIHEL